MVRSLPERSGRPGSIEIDRRPEAPGFLSAYPGYRSTALLDRLLRAAARATQRENGRAHDDSDCAAPLLSAEGRAGSGVTVRLWLVLGWHGRGVLESVAPV
jgi:hypothetical protein